MRMEGQTLVKAVLALFLLYVVCLGANAEDNTCFPSVHVRRYTVQKVLEMSTLTLSCPVKYCEEPPNVTWCKLMDVEICRTLAENSNVRIWQMPNNTEENLMTSYMEIKNITKNDSGLYRCGASDTTVGHSITVHVTDVDQLENTTYNPNRSSDKNNPNPDLEWLSYVYICGGIVTLVFLVMLISFLSLHGCKRSSQYHPAEPTGPSQLQNSEQIAKLQCPTRKSSACLSPSLNVPKRDRSLQCHSPRSPALSKPAYDKDHLNETSLHGLLTLPRAPPSQGSASSKDSALLNVSHDNKRDRRPSQVLYAALDHLAPRDASRTLPQIHPDEEFSEYASIRIS